MPIQEVIEEVTTGTKNLPNPEPETEPIPEPETEPILEPETEPIPEPQYEVD